MYHQLDYMIKESQEEADKVILQLQMTAAEDILYYALNQAGVNWNDLMDSDKHRVMEYLNERFN